MRRLLLVVLAGALMLVGAAPATADTRKDIHRDCSDDGQLSGTYSPADLRDAAQNLPDDLREYSDCVDVLRRATLAGAGGGGNGGDGGSGGSGGGGSSAGSGGTGGGASAPTAPKTDQDRAALEDSANAGEQPRSVGAGDGSGDEESTLVPVGAGTDTASSNDLPVALIVALALLALAGIALSVPPLRRRFRSS